VLKLVEDLGMQYRGCKQKARWYKVWCSRCEQEHTIRASKFDETKFCNTCNGRKGTKAYNGFKVCASCEIKKSVDKFKFRKDSSDGYRSHCSECLSKTASNKWKEDKKFQQRGKERSRKYSLKTKYGLTLEEFNGMCKAVNYSCEICGTHINELSHDTLYVDHCHTTGKIRGLLCNTCNSGISMLQDDETIMLKAIDYINKERPDAKAVPDSCSL